MGLNDMLDRFLTHAWEIWEVSDCLAKCCDEGTKEKLSKLGKFEPPKFVQERIYESFSGATCWQVPWEKASIAASSVYPSNAIWRCSRFLKAKKVSDMPEKKIHFLVLRILWVSEHLWKTKEKEGKQVWWHKKQTFKNLDVLSLR